MEELIGIIGAGRLGASLARALSEAGCTVPAVCDRDVRKAEQTASSCGDVTIACAIDSLPQHLTLVILAVPDDDIVKVGIQLAQHLTPDEDRIVAHTSGVLNADVLSAVLPHHKLVASMHPVQTLSGSEKDWKRLFNITYGIQGPPDAVHRLKNIVHKLDGKIVLVQPAGKALYHLACVIAANFTVGLQHAAVRMLNAIGIEERDALTMLAPLVRATLENILEQGPASALTGPVSRGDIGTVKKHYDHLEKKLPELLTLYSALSKYLVSIAVQQGKADEKALEEIVAFLNAKGEHFT
ncbi:hypothetical protein A2V82_03765 [candidate division KSB1 bacterium RBG_16_48_16]|nr:MAG: hypothetical protein A2V82_03765 [candidate division KSB1 bacterium RBG_16_48_16]